MIGTFWIGPDFADVDITEAFQRGCLLWRDESQCSHIFIWRLRWQYLYSCPIRQHGDATVELSG